jgi:hypothetical protein
MKMVYLLLVLCLSFQFFIFSFLYVSIINAGVGAERLQTKLFCEKKCN